MTKRRNVIDIKIDLLTTAKTPNKATRMMYACNLSWKPMRALFIELIEKGLLRLITPEEYSKKNTTSDPINPSKPFVDKRTASWYVITKTGLEVLEAYEKIRTLTSDRRDQPIEIAGYGVGWDEANEQELNEQVKEIINK